MKNNYLKKDGYFFALIDFLKSPPLQILLSIPGQKGWLYIWAKGIN